VTTFTSLDELAAFLDESPARIIGLVGAPGAGKSTIADALSGLITSATVLPMDGYHLPPEILVDLGRRDRMGAPDTFDVAAFAHDLRAVRDFRNSGVSVAIPGFDRTQERSVAAAITIVPELRKVIVEGNYLLHGADGWQHIAPLLDLSFFVDIDPDLRRARLIERHVRYGKSHEDAAAWALGPDEANALLIEQTARHADHTIRLLG
jgi:pantothenate kinase